MQLSFIAGVLPERQHIKGGRGVGIQRCLAPGISPCLTSHTAWPWHLGEVSFPSDDTRHLAPFMHHRRSVNGASQFPTLMHLGRLITSAASSSTLCPACVCLGPNSQRDNFSVTKS